MTPSKPSRLFKTRKKYEELIREYSHEEKGVFLSSIDINDSLEKKSPDRLVNCLLRSILIFMASFGTIGGVVNAFGLQYNPIIVIPAFIIVSVVISLLYYNRLCFYLGYVFIFIIFAVLTISFYWYINSGFQAFLNTLYEKYSDYFNISSLREGNEVITNRILTVSATMIYVGTFLAILLNITISGYMSLVETFLITFPIMQFALYINLKPGAIYMVFVIATYITVGILHRSSHYRLPTIKHSKKKFITQYDIKHNVHSYLSSGSGMFKLTLLSTVFASIFVIICLNTFYNKFSPDDVRNKLKQKTDEYVKLVVQNGFLGLFDRYSSVGGLAEGKLGGVSSVRPDYQNDFLVTYVPYSMDTIYLKAFVGGDYVTNQFQPAKLMAFPDSEIRAHASENALSDYALNSGNYTKMQINNIGANTRYHYLPYETVAVNSVNGVEYSHSTNINDAVNLFDSSYPTNLDGYKYELIFTPPNSDAKQFAVKNEITPNYEAFVYENFTQVPDYLRETLITVDFTSGLNTLYSDYAEAKAKGASPEVLAEKKNNMADALYKYFFDNYTYTMAPGTTPYGKDTIIHFLTKSKRGYCAYFASSATMLLRNLGIPARYVEGYVIKPTDLSEAVGISKDLKGWASDTYNNNFNVDGDAGVIQVAITDGNAHAWVEIYYDGIGWIPYDFTPPSSGEEVSDLSFANIFANLMMTSDESSLDENGNSILNYTFNFNLSFGFIVKPLLIILAVLIISLILYAFLRPAIIALICFILCKKNCYNKAYILKFKELTRAVKKQYQAQKIEPGINDIFDKLTNEKDDTPKDCIILITQKAFYSSSEISPDDYQKAVKYLKKSKIIKAE